MPPAWAGAAPGAACPCDPVAGGTTPPPAVPVELPDAVVGLADGRVGVVVAAVVVIVEVVVVMVAVIVVEVAIGVEAILVATGLDVLAGIIGVDAGVCWRTAIEPLPSIGAASTPCVNPIDTSTNVSASTDEEAASMSRRRWSRILFLSV